MTIHFEKSMIGILTCLFSLSLAAVASAQLPPTHPAVSEELLEKYGYRIDLIAAANKFEATAVPVEYGKTGRLSYFIDESGVLRAGDHGGGAATIADQPVE